MELSDYLRLLRKNWLLIVVATVLGFAAAAAWSATRTPLYSAQSTVFVSTQSGGTVSELQQGAGFAQARITTYTNLVTTPIVVDPVIESLALGVSAGELAGRISATNPLNSTLVEITVQDPDPAAAADIANALGTSLTTTVEQIETPAGQDVSPVRLTQVEDAVTPSTPVSPNVPLNLVLGLLVGLALGVGIAVLLNALDNRIRSPRDIEKLTDRPIIGAIPFDSRAKVRPIILQADPQNQRSEAFRSLRTNLQFIELDGGHSFVITSSMASEGKSTTAVNLAIALADAGKRVALIDADLRKPKVAEYLGIEGGAGLTDVLIGRTRVGDVMLPWGDRTLWVLPAGRIPPNPSELLGSSRMEQLLEAFSREFDVVICDAPPLLPVTDAAVLSRLTTGAAVVVAAGKTTIHQLQSAFESLNTVGSKIAGTVITMVPTRGPDAYGYGYGYGYGGYGTTQTDDDPGSRSQRRRARRAGVFARRSAPIPDAAG